MTHLTCTDCGSADVRRETEGKKGPVSIKKLTCVNCGATGEAVEQHSMTKGGVTRNIRDGPFAELSNNGLQTLRANLDDPAFAPVV